MVEKPDMWKPLVEAMASASDSRKRKVSELETLLEEKRKLVVERDSLTEKITSLASGSFADTGSRFINVDPPVTKKAKGKDPMESPFRSSGSIRAPNGYRGLPLGRGIQHGNQSLANEIRASMSTPSLSMQKDVFMNFAEKGRTPVHALPRNAE